MSSGFDDDLLRSDDTLADAPVDWPAEAPLRRALADQRFVHALLRALHTADAAHREARVQAILQLLPARRRVLPLRLATAAAAALLLAALGVLWTWLGRTELPRAEAMVERTLQVLRQPVDRSYAVDITLQRPQGRSPIHARYALTLRDERRFRLTGDGLLGPVEAGSDGQTLWVKPAIGWLRWSRPWSRRCRLGSLLSQGRLDAGDVDLHGLLAKLRQHTDLLAVERVPATGTRRAQIRIEVRGMHWAPGHVKAAVVLLDEATSELQRVEVTTEPLPGWEKQAVFDYRGEAKLSERDYHRPW